jgi:hypothetical protein
VVKGPEAVCEFAKSPPSTADDLGNGSDDDMFLENSISMGAEGPPPRFRDMGSTGESSISGRALGIELPLPKSNEIWRVDPPPPPPLLLPIPAFDNISNPKS